MREQTGVAAGDVLEGAVVRGKIMLTPRSAIAQGIAQSMKDFAKGLSHGPFATHGEFVTSLRTETVKTRD